MTVRRHCAATAKLHPELLRLARHEWREMHGVPSELANDRRQHRLELRAVVFMLRERPRATLGPKYTVTYVMPGPDNTSSTIRQDVYPYAKPYVLSYTKPGQRFWGNHTTHGGWYQALPELRSTLIAAGLPKQPTTVAPGDGSGWLRWVAISITIAAGITLLTILTVLGLRRRPRPAAA